MNVYQHSDFFFFQIIIRVAPVLPDKVYHVYLWEVGIDDYNSHNIIHRDKQKAYMT